MTKLSFSEKMGEITPDLIEWMVADQLVSFSSLSSLFITLLFFPIIIERFILFLLSFKRFILYNIYVSLLTYIIVKMFNTKRPKLANDTLLNKMQMLSL